LAHLIEVPSEEILAATEEDVRRASAWYGQKPTDAAGEVRQSRKVSRRHAWTLGPLVDR